MAEFQHLCMGCMQPIEQGEAVCPHCSYNALSPQYAPYLPKETVLSGRYLVGKIVSISTDSATYIALDLQSRQVINIVEYLPEKLVARAEGSSTVNVRVSYEDLFNSCMQEFVNLWQTIMSVKDCPALPQVKDVFFCNSTAYAVCEYVDCITFKEYMRSTGKLLPWASACNAFKSLLTALSKLHSVGIIHEAISPSTIFVGSDGKLHLGGFSIPQTKSDIFELTSRPAPGYAPIELSDSRIRVGAYTDVYSIAAVMYFAVTGIEPQDAVDRAVSDNMMIPVEIARKIPSDAIDALISSLQIYPQRRIRTIDQYITAIYDGGIEKIKSQIQKLTGEVSKPTSLKSDERKDSDDDIDDYDDDDEDEDEDDDDEPKTKVKRDKKPPSTAAIVAKVFVTTAVIIAMLFCTLYATVLYKTIDIPILNKAFSSFSFLPVSDADSKEHTQASDETSQPPEMVAVANFEILTYSDIINNKTFNSNYDIKYQFDFSDTVEKNSIISQSIASGETVEKGSQITLVISKGKPVATLIDVIGMQYEDAYELLTHDGFVVSKKYLKNDGAQIPERVFTMSLVAGIEFEEGTPVVLSVWDNTNVTEATAEEPSKNPLENLVEEFW